jgi:thiamine pyrophosphate-dependent acetolactate synthase large subunit-like protein
MAVDAKLPIPCQRIAAGRFHGRMVVNPEELHMTLKNDLHHDKPVFVDVVIVNRRALSIPLSINTESRPVSVFKWSWRC